MVTKGELHADNIMATVHYILLLLLILEGRIIGTIAQTGVNDSIPSNSAETTEDICDNPDYNLLKERLLLNYDTFEDLYRLPPLAEASSLPKYLRTNSSCYVQGSRQECISLQSHANSQGGVTCPSRLVMNRDVNRVPCVIKEQKCLCRQCLIPHSLQSRRVNSTCEPIQHYVPVMRRTTDQIGGDVWTYVLEPVVVGCTCSTRRHVFSSRS